MTCLVFLILLCQNAPPAAPVVPSQNESLAPTHSICFSPGGNCIKRIREVIDEARVSVLVQAYSLTSAPIGKALATAHNRGVQVEVILDAARANEEYSHAENLSKAGVMMLVDNNHALAHNKRLLSEECDHSNGRSAQLCQIAVI